MNPNQSKTYPQKRVRTETHNASKRSSIGLSERTNDQNVANGLWVLADIASNSIRQTEDRFEYLKTTLP